MKISLSLLLIVFALYQISQFPTREKERKSRIAELKYIESKLEFMAWQMEVELLLMEMEAGRKPFDRWKKIFPVFIRARVFQITNH